MASVQKLRFNTTIGVLILGLVCTNLVGRSSAVPVIKIPIAANSTEHRCDQTAKRDASIILEAKTLYQRQDSSDIYVAPIAAGDSLFYYSVVNSKCKLFRLVALWQNRRVPLTLHLRGGNLKSLAFIPTKSGGDVVVVDSWGRSLTRPVVDWNALTLDAMHVVGPLHAGVAVFGTEIAPEVVVGRNGPTLIYVDFDKPFPPEWNVSDHKYHQSNSVYNP